MLSPVTSHHHHHGSAAGGGGGNTSTPSQLRSAVAGIWSSVLSSGGSNGTNNLPNHGIPVASTFETLREKHHQTLVQMKLSDPDMSETITRGLRRFQMKMRESQAQTNACIQCIGIPYLYTELHDNVRYEIAQAKVLQIQAQQQLERTSTNNNLLSSPAEDRKFRIARELAEARIKAHQALQLQNKNNKSKNSTNDDDDTISLASSSASTASSEDNVVDGQQQQLLSSPVMMMMKPPNGNSNSSSKGQHSPTSVIGMDDDDIHNNATAGATSSSSSSYVHLTLQQKQALLSVHDVDDEDDIQEVPTVDSNDDDSDDEESTE
jgi:hypothetical protein